MDNLKRLARAVLESWFYEDYYEWRINPVLIICRHCSGNMPEGEIFTDAMHAEICPVLLARRVLNE